MTTPTAGAKTPESVVETIGLAESLDIENTKKKGF
jgi:hypothetical protein